MTISVRVEVPATTANLGPGFDSLGMALDLCDVVTLSRELSAGRDVVEIEGECAHVLPRDETHLVLQTIRHTFKSLGYDPGPLKLECVNAIPHGRGLGSSAAAIVGALTLAKAFAQRDGVDVSGLDIFELAAEHEGHPDNVAPCTYGGLTIAWRESERRYAAVRLVPHPGIAAWLAIPDVLLSTKAARELLPQTVPLREAAANSGRAALAVHAFTQDPSLLVAATKDYLHQGYRASAYPDSYALVQKLRGEGVAAAISGAGPAVIVFADLSSDPSSSIDQGIFAVRQLSIRAEGAKILD